MSKSTTPKYSIGFVLFEEYEVLDLMGPFRGHWRCQVYGG